MDERKRRIKMSPRFIFWGVHTLKWIDGRDIYQGRAGLGNRRIG